MSDKYVSPYRELSIREEDKIWLARMCVGEGGFKCSREHASAMMWAMVNRYLLHKWRDKWADDFIKFLQAFSQPINPRWRKGGDLALKNANKRSGSRAALRRREKICALLPDDIPETVWNAVDDFAIGCLPLPAAVTALDRPRISNWAAALKSIQKKYPQGIEIQGNWFLEDDELESGNVVIAYGHIDINLDPISSPSLPLELFSSRQLLEELLRRDKEANAS